MNIETTKLELMQLLLQTQKKSILLKLKEVFDEGQSDWYDEMTNEEQSEINIGIEQAEKGELIDNQTVMKHFEKWNSK